jgi:hypothetical protein
MAGGTDKRDNEQNKVAGRIDKSIQNDLKNNTPIKSTRDRFRDEYNEAMRPKSFKEIYPNVGGWEIQVCQLLDRRSLPLAEINEEMNTTGQAAQNWIRDHYNRGIEPKEIARSIKDLFR